MMTTRWNPLIEMQAEMNRLRGEMERMFGRAGTNGRNLLSLAQYPPTNLWEDSENYYVEAELPGMALEDLEIYLNEGVQLTLKGERKQPEAAEGSWHRRERTYGKFVKVIELPMQVQEEGVEAQLKLGVLTLRLPKRPEAKPRRIEVVAD